MKRSAHFSALLTALVFIPTALWAQSTVYMASSSASVFDHSSGNSANIGLNYSNATALRGVAITLEINSPNIQPSSVTLGSAIANPANWSFDYQVTNGVTGSSIEVILYGKTSNDVLATADYPQLFVVHYTVPDLALCNSAPGGDITSGTLSFSSVNSTKNDGLGSSAAVAIDGARPNHVVTIHNTSSRGDVDCNDRVDVLDLSKSINVLAKRATFSDWQKNRADLAPWSSQWAVPGTFFSDATNYGDGTVNVQDVVLMADAILNAKWPDNKALYRVRGGGSGGGSRSSLMGKQSAFYDVKVTCFVKNTGVDVWMENKTGVASLQFDLRVGESAETIEAKMNEKYAGSFMARAKRNGDVVRVLVYSLTGDAIAIQNGSLIEIPMTITDPAKVSIVEPVIAGDQNSNPLLVEYEVTSTTSGVAANSRMVGVDMGISPNPTHAGATLQLDLEKRQRLTVRIVDMVGREVSRPVDRIEMSAGLHRVGLPVEGLPSGTYQCVVIGAAGEMSRTLVVTR